MSDVPDLPGDDEDGPQLPPELAALFEQLGLGGEGGELPPELTAMFEQLGLGGEGGIQLPPELGAAFEQLHSSGGLEAMQRQAAAMFGGGLPGALFGAGSASEGPVDWTLATRVALQLAADGDRAPTAEEAGRAQEAMTLAEHWLDASPLPAPPDAGRLAVSSRQEWVNAAVTAFRPLVDPVARASTQALVELAREQFDQLGDAGEAEAPALPAELAGLQGMISQLSGGDLGELLRPVGAALSGLQAGQVLGQLSRTLLGQYDLAIPTAPRSTAHVIAVNVADAFDGWDLDPTEVALVLALHEGAMRRLYHAVPWLEAHVQSLVARFAAGTQVDTERLEELTRDMLQGIDPDDPEGLEQAMARASDFRLEPTPDQQRVLQRLQGVICLVGAWARHEVARAADGRVPSLSRIAEVQRRRRVTRGDGEDLLAALLGLDLRPEDETIGDRFVVAVEDALGPEGLRRALEHPENLPDAGELADPSAWLVRMSDAFDLPDDPAALFEGLGEAPREGTAQERAAGRDVAEEGTDRSDDREAHGASDGGGHASDTSDGDDGSGAGDHGSDDGDDGDGEDRPPGS